MRLLIDTDPGIDDAMAIALAFASPEAQIEAITTVAGNTDVEQATANVLRLLSVARPTHLPRVARGAAAPLRHALVTSEDFHGGDGLGHLERFVDPDGRPRYPVPTHALETLDGADVILETADRLRDELVIVALGPLTNLAIALSRDRGPLSRVGRIIVMGGAVGVPGNVTAAAEFNFYVDPHAAAAVFEADLPIELVPLDVTEQVVLREAELEARLARSDSPVGRFIGDFTAHSFASFDRRMALHDPLAMGVALDPSLVTWEALHVAVERDGHVTRGLSLADRRPRPAHSKPRANCRVAMTVDAPRFLQIFLDRVCPASR